MPAQIDEVQTYDADPATVFAMLCDEEFIRYKSTQSGSLEVDATVTEEEDGIRIHNRRVMPAKVPGFVKRFLGDTIPLDETQHWGEADEDGARTAQFTVDFDGQPLSFGGTITLRPHGAGGTAVETSGPIKCSVPFVGGRIEKFAAEWIGKYLNKEQRVGAQWLIDHQ
ncbi:MAG: DUF2505 domain-containing protein [Candidatus Nanopelagicales bacterium]|jgi:hypothetical protein|nr:DUF2505 domain-containing protein [Candidatus Nanopelagicales bacterium]